MTQASDLGTTGAGPLTQHALRQRAGSGQMVGRVYVWQGGSLWIGTGRGRADWHDHHAHQITFPLGSICQFRSGLAQPWQEYAGAMVPSHQKHQFEADGLIAHLCVEPETTQGRALRTRFAGAGISSIPEPECHATCVMLMDARRRNAGIDEMTSVARSALHALARASSLDGAIDARMTRAIDYLRTRVRHPSSLAEAASVATLSPSRFRHLFVQETGTSFRAYVLWLRLNVAIETAMAGSSWTTAAHEAGFADSAHLTRTFRRMFGINPTTLVPART